MELSYNKVNLAAHQARGITPHDMITRGHANEIWMVPFKPIDFAHTPDWRHYRRDQHVVIPMFPYLVSCDPVDALGFAFQMGVRAMHDLGGKPVRRLHLSLGAPMHQVLDEFTQQVQWSFYLGIGVVLE